MSYLRPFKKALHSQKERIKSKLRVNGNDQPDEPALANGAKQPRAVPVAPLLERLPLEIRLQIWEEVLGGNLFHMQADAPKNGPTQMDDETCEGRPGWRRQTPILGRYLCRNFSSNTTADGKASNPKCQGSLGGPCFFSGPEANSFKPLSLLLTCRQIHDEAVEKLYSTNIFNFENHEYTLREFMSLSRHFNHIRTVHVNASMWKLGHGNFAGIYCTTPETNKEKWVESWLLLSKFEGLQHVRLDIYGTSKNGLQAEDLEPIRQLQGLKTFDLAVWRDYSDPDGRGGQDLVVSVPFQESIRRSVCQ
ncbi:MAG: hypothetical protein Q9168_005658 [Polycauliona sp. 1 TL-2023]